MSYDLKTKLKLNILYLQILCIKEKISTLERSNLLNAQSAVTVHSDGKKIEGKKSKRGKNFCPQRFYIK